MTHEVWNIEYKNRENLQEFLPPAKLNVESVSHVLVYTEKFFTMGVKWIRLSPGTQGHVWSTQFIWMLTKNSSRNAYDCWKSSCLWERPTFCNTRSNEWIVPFLCHYGYLTVLTFDRSDNQPTLQIQPLLFLLTLWSCSLATPNGGFYRDQKY